MNAAADSSYPHAMLAEIHEQPEAIARTLAALTDGSKLRAERFGEATRIFRGHRDLVIAASGSSRHAGLAAEIMLEDTACLTVDVEYASEYITRAATTKRDPAILVISQSGETADTLAALREAKERHHPTLAISNVGGSSMLREADAAFATEAGVERAIPATKSFTTQLVTLRLLSLAAGLARGTVDEAGVAQEIAALWSLPELIEKQMSRWRGVTRDLARRYSNATTLLFLGRGVHYSIAREGALKLKESSYVHAEGYPSGELKHGPNALVSDAVPLVVLATVDSQDAESRLRYEKTLALLGDMREQGARMIVVGNDGDEAMRSVASDFVGVEEVHELLLPVCEVVPLQMFAYEMALENGVDVDRPRNLVKSVVRE